MHHQSQKPLLILFAVSLLLSINAACAQAAPVGNLPNLPGINFGKTVFLNKENRRTLDTAISLLKGYPSCRVIISGHADNCEFCQQVAWDRVYSVREYLIKQGVDSSRLIFAYYDIGEARVVKLIATFDDGPNTVPAPHPLLQLS